MLNKISDIQLCGIATVPTHGRHGDATLVFLVYALQFYGYSSVGDIGHY